MSFVDFQGFVKSNLLLWSAFVLALASLIVQEVKVRRSFCRIIDLTKAVDLINVANCIIIDIRPLSEHKAGSILHAVHVNLADGGAVAKVKENIGQKVLIVLDSKGFSSALDKMLKRDFAGYQVACMEHGFRSWQDAGYPIVAIGEVVDGGK